MNQLEMILTQLPFWNKLDPRDQALLNEHAILKSFSAESLIHSKSQDCLGYIRVISGSIRVYLTSDEGREITLYHIHRDEEDVLSTSCIVHQITFDTFMTAETDCQILIIPTSILSRLKEENIYVRCSIYERLTSRFSDATWVFQDILFLSIEQRIASFLLQESARKKTATLSITQEQLAQEINSVREVVTRALRTFASDGLVKLSRGKIQLIDMDGLKSYSNTI